MKPSDRDGRLIVWFEQWKKPLRSWMRNRGSVPLGDVEDLVQDVFKRVMRYSDDIAVDNPQGYLFRIAANVANEWRERARVRCPHEDTWLESLEISLEDQPENIHEREQFVKTVQAACDRLPPRQRMILLLHVNDGLTYKDIAARHRLTYRIVLRDLTRAYAQLRFELSDLNENNDRRSGRAHPPKAASAGPVPGSLATGMAESDVG